VVLDLSSVPTIDASGLVALEETIDELNEAGIFVALCGAQRAVLGVLRDAGYLKERGKRWYYPSADAAVARLRDLAQELPAAPASRNLVRLRAIKALERLIARSGPMAACQ
jgi:MFS superfamily sulfate permease-like transporter